MKKNQTLIVLFNTLLSLISLSAQQISNDHRQCGTMYILEQHLQHDPEMKERRASIEQSTREWIRRTPSVSERAAINIPVVVHVVYNTAAENISDAQIQSQINVLNRDFRRLNSEVVPAQFANIAADVELTFCLARTDPNGFATTGIERKYTTKVSWSSNDDMKRTDKEGLAAWDANAYLNIWICNLGSSSLGYSSFPGAPIALDGVVIDYRYFGTTNTRAPFNLGRTATHEVGHWLNLYHIWGDSQCGNDQVDDTPLHHGANYGCSSHPSIYRNCGGEVVEMPMNFMDYTNDACMSMFTYGQKARMKALFAVGGARYNITLSRGCQTATPSVCAAPTGLSANNITETTSRFIWINAAATLRSTTLEYRMSTSATWIAIPNIAANSFTINSLEANTVYFARIRTVCFAGGESTFSESIAFKTNAKMSRPNPVTTTCIDTYEYNNTRSTAKFIRINTDIKASIAVAGDRDWFYFQVPSGLSFNVDLTNLFADYDLKMYNSNLRLLRSSENSGTTNEGFNFTSDGQTVFLLHVYGYNGANNVANCYNLKVRMNPNLVNSNVSNQGETVEQRNLTRVLGGGKGELTVFPNPTSGTTFLEINPQEEGMAVISLLNITGQVITTEMRFVSKKEKVIQMDNSNLPNGIYLLTVKQGESIWIKRLTISK